MADGLPGPCWCTTLAPVVAVPGEGAGCWCPACLQQHIDAASAPDGAADDASTKVQQ